MARSDTTSSKALDLVRAHIAALGLGGGTRLMPERQLADELGLTRRALRRALEVLEAEGALWRRQGSGTFVGQPDMPAPAPKAMVAATNFLEIMEVRLRIEPQLAQLAALRARPEDIDRLQLLCARITSAETDDADARELWDGAFHRQIALSAGNALFLSIFDILNRVRQDPSWQAIRARARTGQPDPMATRRHHAEIVAAIAARDPHRAGEGMREHLLYLQEVLIRQTSLDGAAPGGTAHEAAGPEGALLAALPLAGLVPDAQHDPRPRSGAIPGADDDETEERQQGMQTT
ncbi:FadR/GntR family transcriptional regulator [Frigidibacter sp. MR17.24]|uniref:FadR/GntR family transcriptional regulator n=1 Tax=Frigidibacter sp. MR17.24 TaxID=3127345 RepID=UPI003012C2F3